MIEWEVTDFGLRVLDHANVEVAVRTPDWRSHGPSRDLPRPTDRTIDGVTSELTLPSSLVQITKPGKDYSREFGSETGPIRLENDEYLLDVGLAIKTYILFEGPATVSKSDDLRELVVSFPELTRVTLGFRSRHEYPAGTITVPTTPEGVAVALSHLHSSLKTTNPDRSFPSLRGHPPLVEFGETTEVPATIEEATADTGIELHSPADLEYLYVLAPLAHYLQARVTASSDRDRPLLRAPAAGIEQPLSELPALQEETASLLRRVFYLDCLVRNAGPYGTNLAEAALLDRLSFDAERAYETDPPDRLDAYLEVEPRDVEADLPDWHLSTYVQPDPDHARSLPYLLQKLSLVYLPQTTELKGADLIESSLDDFYRENGTTMLVRASGSQDPVASVDVVKPKLRTGQLHAWLADGVPIDVFKATHSAFENRLDYLERGGDGIEVAVVLNDEEMEDEHAEAADVYRERSKDLPMDVTVHEGLDRDGLAAVFEAENDFVHYIGHCEETGLRCTDGNLSTADIEESNTQTFFLNACGSYHEGMTLLEKGSVVGGVTFKKVLNKQAARVGTTFARLLVHGFSFVRAMQLARRRIMTGKDYAVVGDGTHALTQNEYHIPLQLTLEEDGEEYLLTMDNYSAWMNGGVYQLAFEKGDGTNQTHLCGNRSTYRLTRDDLLRYLDETSAPVIYEGSYYWTTDLCEEL